METKMRNRQAHKKNDRPPPSDADDTAKQLVEIYGINHSAAMIALRRADWDLHNAAMFLSDEGQRADILNEAEKLAESQNGKKTTKLEEEEKRQLPSYLLAYPLILFTTITTEDTMTVIFSSCSTY
jgi:hypothetical protein